MGKGPRIVLAIATELLFKIVGGKFQGFRVLKREIIKALEENARWLEKDEAEKNPAFKQIIVYCTLTSNDGKIFSYRRAEQDQAYPERRLQGNWSIGIGGHIEPVDYKKEGPILASIRREIDEEVSLDGPVESISFLGGINDDLNAVGQVHFGLFTIAQTSSRTIVPKDPEIASGELKTPQEVDVLLQRETSVDPWTRIAFPYFFSY